MVRNGQIGFIGLGIMGRPMARNVIGAGYKLVVYDIDQGPVRELVAEGALQALSPADVARQVDIVILMLPDSPQVEEVMLGENGVLVGAREGVLVIDMSSIAPLVSRKVAEQAQIHGVKFMDAPVSGGEPGAIDGTLSIMVGGDKADYDRVLPLLKTMGANVVRIGEVGSGNIAKLANQIMVALNIAAMGEALTLATKAGVSPGLVYEAVRGGLAGSNVLDAKAPLVLQRAFEPGFRVDLHFKDLNNVMQTAHSLGVPLPLTGFMVEILSALRSQGYGGCDHGAIVRFHEQLAGIEICDSISPE